MGAVIAVLAVPIGVLSGYLIAVGNKEDRPSAWPYVFAIVACSILMVIAGWHGG